MLIEYANKFPQVIDKDKSAWVADSAVLLGDVRLGGGASVWFGATIRGDNEPITLGAASNVQENSVLHTDMGFPLVIGREVTIGHGAIVHGCTIGDGSIIGMGAIVLNGAKVGPRCLIAAGSVVREGVEIPPGSLVAGSPAVVKRTLDADEQARLTEGAADYVAKAPGILAEIK